MSSLIERYKQLGKSESPEIMLSGYAQYLDKINSDGNFQNYLKFLFKRLTNVSVTEDSVAVRTALNADAANEKIQQIVKKYFPDGEIKYSQLEIDGKIYPLYGWHISHPTYGKMIGIGYDDSRCSLTINLKPSDEIVGNDEIYSTVNEMFDEIFESVGCRNQNELLERLEEQLTKEIKL